MRDKLTYQELNPRVQEIEKNQSDFSTQRDREVHLKNVLLAIRDVNQLIARETDTEQLIRKICASLVKTRGYFNAWIALTDENGKVVESSAASGFNGGFDIMESALHRGEFPLCMRHSLGKDEIAVTRNPPADCPDCPLSSEYEGRSGLTCRLSHGDRVFGIISVSVPKKFAYDSEEQDLFSELAADLGHALRKLKTDVQAKIALQESEVYYRTLFENVNDAVLVHEIGFDGLPGKFIDANSVALKRLGYTHEELLKLTPKDITTENGYKELSKARANIISNSAAIFETIHYARNGRPIPVESHVSVVELAGQRVAVSVIRDLSERKRAEEALRNKEAWLGETMRIARVGGWKIDLLGNTLEWTDETFQIHELPTGDPPNVAEAILFYHAEDRPRVSASVQHAIENGEGFDFEARIITAKQNLIWVHLIGHASFHEGRMVLVWGTIQDITEIKQAEAEREKLQTQLNQAQKMESVGRLAGGVAHDFNNMLGVILGHTELALLKADEDNDLISDLKEIQNAAKRSANLTKQLLTFARKEIISPRKLDLNDTVESMLNMLRRLIGEDIDLVWQPAAHIWPVKMDPSQIDQTLANLCVNARDAIDGVGKLTIETGRKTFDEEYCKEHRGFIPGDFVLLAVSDNGCGMDKDTLDNLFEPFFTTKEVGKGTGLGLATIYGIVKQNNGFINVYSEPGQGSTFKIYLPRLVADEDIDKAVPEKKAAAGGTETILLVEDEPTILRMTRMMLERKGYTVLPAATPVKAIEIAKTHADKIHLLMTDVVMPEMNGRDLAGQLIPLYPEIKRLFMSGYTSNVIAHHGVLDKGVAFIQKPFSMADMTEKVRGVLDIFPDKNQ
jgi:PAS domain S-box-containing protein